MTEQENNDNPIFGVTCANLHTSYYDKREVCPDSGVIVVRRLVQEDDKELDELLLTCKTRGCNEQVVVRVDCEDYK